MHKVKWSHYWMDTALAKWAHVQCVQAASFKLKDY